MKNSSFPLAVFNTNRHLAAATLKTEN